MPRDTANHISWTLRNPFVLASIAAYRLFPYQLKDYWSVASHDTGKSTPLAVRKVDGVKVALLDRRLTRAGEFWRRRFT
ncbi:MAG: hypothetical protein ACREA4_03560, partial [Nitrososphaera sp.]